MEKERPSRWSAQFFAEFKERRRRKGGGEEEKKRKVYCSCSKTYGKQTKLSRRCAWIMTDRNRQKNRCMRKEKTLTVLSRSPVCSVDVPGFSCNRHNHNEVARERDASVKPAGDQLTSEFCYHSSKKDDEEEEATSLFILLQIIKTMTDMMLVVQANPSL